MDIKTHLLINQPNSNGWRMLPNEKDKEALVIDLLNKGYKTRQIVKLAHVSNTTVKKNRQKLPAEVKQEQKQGDQKNEQLSVSSQAFRLFLEGKSVVQVAIGLDLPTEQILKIRSDYLVLWNMGMASYSNGKPKESWGIFETF